MKAGYGVLVHWPDGTSSELYGACGEYCTNFDAEIVAIETALYNIRTTFDSFPSKARNLIIFTDALSVLQTLQGNPHTNAELKQIQLDCHYLMKTYGVGVVMQWIPGYSNTPAWK